MLLESLHGSIEFHVPLITLACSQGTLFSSQLQYFRNTIIVSSWFQSFNLPIYATNFPRIPVIKAALEATKKNTSNSNTILDNIVPRVFITKPTSRTIHFHVSFSPHIQPTSRGAAARRRRAQAHPRQRRGRGCKYKVMDIIIIFLWNASASPIGSSQLHRAYEESMQPESALDSSTYSRYSFYDSTSREIKPATFKHLIPHRWNTKHTYRLLYSITLLILVSATVSPLNQ